MLFAVMLGAFGAPAGPIPPEPVPPSVTSPEWFKWYEGVLADRLSASPRERAVSFYFSREGDDSTGDGSMERPWRSLAQARRALAGAPAIGGIGLYFRRGDTFRDSQGIDTALPHVTIADYGDEELAKPLLTPFTTVGIPALWSPVAGHPGVYSRPEPRVVTWLKEDDDLDDPSTRCSSLVSLASRAGAWWHDRSAGVLYVRPKPGPGGEPTDPRSDGKAYEIVTPTGAGVIVRGHGSRIENIRAWGWGMQLETPSQQHGIEIRTSGSDSAVAIGCESHYGSSHAMTFYNGGFGGLAAFVDCRAGLTAYNGPPQETIFNSFATYGGQRTIFHGCIATHGTLPSDEWLTSDDADIRGRRGIAFYAHSGGPNYKLGQFISFGSVTRATRWGCHSPGSAEDLPTAAHIGDVQGFFVNETFEANSGTGHDFAVCPRNAVRMNGSYSFRPRPLEGSRACAAWTQNGWLVNSTVEIDCTNQPWAVAFYNALPTQQSSPRIWHSTIVAHVRPGQEFRIDWDVPSQSPNGSVVNSVLAALGGGTLRPNVGLLARNAYFNADLLGDGSPIVLDEMPSPARPDCAGLLACAAGPLPQGVELSFDQSGLARARHAVGPLEPLRCADFNLDGQVDLFDYLDFAAAFSAEAPGADFNGDGQIDMWDYLDFAAAFARGCP